MPYAARLPQLTPLSGGPSSFKPMQNLATIGTLAMQKRRLNLAEAEAKRDTVRFANELRKAKTDKKIADLNILGKVLEVGSKAQGMVSNQEELDELLNQIGLDLKIKHT